MGMIVNGVGVGFFAALFISLYAEGFFNHIFPVWLIYGILAPLFSAIALTLMLVSRKKEKPVAWYEEKKEE